MHQATISDNEWYSEWQRVTMNDNEWYKECQRVVKWVRTNDNEWQCVVISANPLFFEQERNPKENPLNVGKDLEEDLLN